MDLDGLIRCQPMNSMPDQVGPDKMTSVLMACVHCRVFC